MAKHPLINAMVASLEYEKKSLGSDATSLVELNILLKTFVNMIHGYGEIHIKPEDRAQFKNHVADCVALALVQTEPPPKGTTH